MTAPQADIRAKSVEPASSTRAGVISPPRNHAAKEASIPPPADAAALLRTVANAAADFTELLDTLRDYYPAEGLQGPHPVNVALEQAAAAAHDLCVSAYAAADIIGRHPAGNEVTSEAPSIVSSYSVESSSLRNSTVQAATEISG